MKKSELFAQAIHRTHCGILDVKESAHSLLSFLKITQFRQYYTA